MDDLAIMANGCLLPIVNSQATTFPFAPGDMVSTAWDEANCYYDKFTSGILPFVFYAGGGGGVETVSPQPNYSFALNAYVNLVSGATYGADIGGGRGNCYFTVVDGSYDFIIGSTWHETAWPFAGEKLTADGFDYIYTTKCFYLKAGTYVLSGEADQPVKSVVTKSQGAWLNELNRIRGDAMALTGLFNVGFDNPLLRNPAAVCSGPWCVGVNDPVTWPMGAYAYLQGVLQGTLTGSVYPTTPSTPMVIFNNVSFYSASDSLSVFSALGDGSTQSMGFATTNSGNDYTSNIFFNTTQAGTLKATIKFQVVLTVIYGDFGTGGVETFPATPLTAASLGLASSLGSVTTTFLSYTHNYDHSNNIGGWQATYDVLITLDEILTVGETALTVTYTIPTTGWLDQSVYYNSHNAATGGATLNPIFVFATHTGVISSGIHPTDSVYQVVCGLETWPQFKFYNGTATLYPTACWIISDPVINGVWTAKTLPVPGMNVFLDQDFPPYIGETIGPFRNLLGQNIDIATAGNGKSGRYPVGQTGNPYATTMRQTAPISFDVETNSIPVYLNDKVQSMSPGITCRPAKWLVRRDTDFVPYELGFNTIQHTTYSNQIANAAGDLIYYSVSVPPNATSVKIRLVKSGTVPGWRAGVFQYGAALAENLNILVKKSTYPTSTSDCDFYTANNAVTIDPDGGGSYLATILNNGFAFAIQTVNGHAVLFDVYVQIETTFTTPDRVYLPPVDECFSYVMDGTPGAFAEYQAFLYGGTTAKPIPQSGYCIFKVRATRLPVGSPIAITPSSGALLTITIGQNILAAGVLTFTPFKNPDASNLTITIPANARDSGDVKVFIPVLAGNEIVYQCSAQIIFEAWVNWQPVWFNKMYGMGQFPFDTTYAFNAPTPTVFQYALSFVNDFDVTNVGWPQVYPESGVHGSVVQFPLFRELYDDTVALLVLLGGHLPTGNQAAGAGGTGSAGGGAGSGGGAGGGAGGGFDDQL